MAPFQCIPTEQHVGCRGTTQHPEADPCLYPSPFSPISPDAHILATPIKPSAHPLLEQVYREPMRQGSSSRRDPGLHTDPILHTNAHPVAPGQTPSVPPHGYPHFLHTTVPSSGPPVQARSVVITCPWSYSANVTSLLWTLSGPCTRSGPWTWCELCV